MGSRDFRRHETKKPKKEEKKSLVLNVAPPTPIVEVIKKGKKEKSQE